MSDVFGKPFSSSGGEEGEAQGPGAAGAGRAEDGPGHAPGAAGYGQGAPGAAAYGQSVPGAAGYGPGGYAAGSGWGAYPPGGPGAAGFGQPGYAQPSDGDDGGRRPWWRRKAVLAGTSVMAAAALTIGGLGAANAFGSTVLTTQQITAKVSPGLVDVVSTLGFQGAKAAGTGMVLTSNGEVLTNNHVIDGATSIKATDIGNGRTYTAKVVGYDKSADVAVLKLVGASGLDTVSLSSTPAKVGDKVVALGNAGGQGGAPSVATGHVTGLGQTITASDETAGNAEQLTGMTRTNANIQPGDSGGPLVNTSGNVMGMNTAASSGISTTGFQQTAQTQTQAFAIPISKADAIADQIEAGKASSAVHIGATAFLGVQVSSASAGGFGGFGSSAGTGATVAGVVPGSAAEQAGLTQGDQITSVAGQNITSPAGLSSVLHNHHAGDKVSITWIDQLGQSHTATVTLGSGPAD
jgi:S1-C subfamily serine protease